MTAFDSYLKNSMIVFGDPMLGFKAMHERVLNIFKEVSMNLAISSFLWELIALIRIRVDYSRSSPYRGDFISSSSF